MFRSVLLFCLLLCTQFYLRSADANGVGRTSLSLSLDYRKVFCNGDLPRGKYGVFTFEWKPKVPRLSHKNFTSLADLCSAHGNPKANLGAVVRKLYFVELLLLLTDFVFASAPRPVSYGSTL